MKMLLKKKEKKENHSVKAGQSLHFTLPHALFGFKTLLQVLIVKIIRHPSKRMAVYV